MANLIDLKTVSDNRGDLTVIDRILPFDIKRVYYIYNTNENCRGGHKHKKNVQALVSVHGSCNVICGEKTFNLDSPNKCLILEPDDFHHMCDFENNCVLLVLSSEHFDEKDYIRNED
jgi:hypothetical protein